MALSRLKSEIKCLVRSENKEDFLLATLEHEPEGGTISDAGLSAFQASMNDEISGCQPECGHSMAFAYR
jgi:hypothetical protein